MKQVQILIDSACDMQQPEAERLGVTLLPLRTSFDGEVFLDGVDLSHEAFFEKLTQSKTLPTTSQVPPYDYEKAYRQAQKAGREILVITLSSRLSGTYQSAVIAAQQTMHTARRRGMFVPNVRASSPGSGSRLSFQRRRSSTPQETAIAGAPSLRESNPAALRLPISQ